MSQTAVHLAPVVPWALFWALAVLGALAVAPGLLARRRGALWRTAFLAALLAALANPVATEKSGTPLPDRALVFVDRSESQTIGKRAARTEEALEAVRQAFGKDEALEIREIDFGNRPGANGTELGAPLSSALAEVPAGQFAGAIVITDGAIHDRPERAGLPELSAPVHVLLTGDRHMLDRRLVVEEAPEYALVGRPFDLLVRVEDSDEKRPKRQAELVVRQDGREIFRQAVRNAVQWPVPLRLDARGTAIVEVEVEALKVEGKGETSLRNNRAVLAINAVRDRLRVLLISGEPHQGARIWRAALRSDPAVDLIHFTILKLPTSRDPTPVEELALIPFPIDELFEVQLRRFDLVIFDRYTLRGVLPMPYLANLADYVRGGGAILLSTGPEFHAPSSLANSPLADVLPALPVGDMIEQGFRPELTRAGRRHPVSAGLPEAGGGLDGADGPAWGRWFRMASTQKAGGDTLLSGADGRPLLILARAGDGRVAQLLSDQVWMWARGIEGGGPYAELLRRTAHWLMKEPDLEEEALSAFAEQDRLVVEKRSLHDEGGAVIVTAPDGTEEEIALEPQGDGRSLGTAPLRGSGLYRAREGSRQVLAGVGELNPREFADPRPSDEPLRPLVEASGGSAHWLEDGLPRLRRVPAGASTWGRGWLGLPRREASRTEDVTERPLLPVWLMLAALLGLLFGAWWRESR